MKKILGILLMFGFVVSLSACGNKGAETDTDLNTDNVAVVEVEESNDDSKEVNLQEYQLNFDLVSSDGAGNDMVMNMDIFQKGDKALYIMNDMPTSPDMPIITHKSLTVNGKNYIEMEVNGEINWFVAEGVDATLLDDQMFNLEKMQEEMERDADKVEKEKIDGRNMICYYKNDGTQDGKACTYKGVFAYAEAMMLDGSNIQTTMKVSNYKDSVKDSIFEEPKDAKDMMELMGMMGG